jgi:hypothetical protein
MPGQTTRKEFGPNDATMSVFGKVVDRFKKISYGTKAEATKNYSGNNKLTSYSMGKEEEECTLEVYVSQIIEWQKEAKARKGKTNLTLLDPLPIAMTYINDDNDEQTDIITIKILSNGREVAGGSEGLSRELETLCLGIEYDV